MFNIPIAFIIYKRLNTTERVFRIIQLIKPKKIYLIADGPKSDSESTLCKNVRSFVESNIDWDCQPIKIYSENNLGCAKRVQTGLDHVFKLEQMAIILEDDTLPNPSFFQFCEELLLRYAKNEQVAHISGCNLYQDLFKAKESYCFSSIINIWGWATWKRAWEKYHINMPSWNNTEKDKFLSKWCSTRHQKNGMRKVFDLHCDNPDPWTWDSQWVYACWKNNGLSIIPSQNLVSNIGIGPDATNTKVKRHLEIFPERINQISFPLIHPIVELDQVFDKAYISKTKLPPIRTFKNFAKSLIEFFNFQKTRENDSLN